MLTVVTNQFFFGFLVRSAFRVFEQIQIFDLQFLSSNFSLFSNFIDHILAHEFDLNSFSAEIYVGQYIASGLYLFSGFHSKGAVGEFKTRWLPPVPLVYPQPLGFFGGVCWRKKTKRVRQHRCQPIDSIGCILFKPAWLQKNKQVATKYVGPTRKP